MPSDGNKPHGAAPIVDRSRRRFGDNPNSPLAQAQPYTAPSIGGALGRHRTPRERMLARVYAAILVLGIGYLAVVTTLSHNAAPNALPRLLQYAPWSGVAHARLSDYALEHAKTPADLVRVDRMSRRALMATPYATNAARNIGLAQDIAKNKLGADKIMSLIGGATLRDPITHAWLMQRRFEQKRYGEALHEIDVFLRQSPDRANNGFAALTKIVAEGTATPDLVKRLTLLPPWRGPFLAYLGVNGRAPDQEYALFAAMRRTSAPASAEELDSYFMRERDQQDPAQLRQRWISLLTRPLTQDEIFLRDGDFEGSDLPQPYIWQLYPHETGFAETVPSPNEEGQALHVQSSSKDEYSVAAQLLALQPGAYLLSGRVYMNAEDNRGNLAFELTCRRGNGMSAPVATMVLPNSKPGAWQDFANVFQLPANCPGQILWITTKEENEDIAVAGWLDDLKLVPYQPKN